MAAQAVIPTLRRPMIIHPLIDRRFLRERARADYLDAERNLFMRWGPTACQHLTDDDRRHLAKLGKAVGWKRLKRIARIAAVTTIRRWHRTLIGHLRAHGGGKPQCTPEVEVLVVKLALENDLGNDAWGAPADRRGDGQIGTLDPSQHGAPHPPPAWHPAGPDPRTWEGQ